MSKDKTIKIGDVEIIYEIKSETHGSWGSEEGQSTHYFTAFYKRLEKVQTKTWYRKHPKILFVYQLLFTVDINIEKSKYSKEHVSEIVKEAYLAWKEKSDRKAEIARGEIVEIKL